VFSRFLILRVSAAVGVILVKRLELNHHLNETTMKLENLADDDRLLRERLREWKPDAPLPPRFREQVWRRIATAEAQAPPTLWDWLSSRLGQALARPAPAVCYVTLLLGVGLFAGYRQAQAENMRTVENLSLRYVQMIDPYHITP
jgi:hypothetical protein